MSGADPIFYINLDETLIGCAGDHRSIFFIAEDYGDQEAVAGSLRKRYEGSCLRKLHDTAPTGMSCHELRIAGMATVPGEARASSLA